MKNVNLKPGTYHFTETINLRWLSGKRLQAVFDKAWRLS